MADSAAGERLAKVIGGNVKRLRLQARMTQERLAEVADVSVDTVSRIERGAFEPSVGTACELAKALGTSVEELVRPAAKRSQRPKAPTTLKLLTERARRLDAKGQRVLLKMAEALAAAGKK